MVLDITLFRQSPDIARESQRRRQKDPSLVDKVLDLDKEWISCLKKVENLKKMAGFCSKIVGEKKKAKEPNGENLPIPEELREKVEKDELTKDELKEKLNPAQLMSFSKEIAALAAEWEVKQNNFAEERQAAIKLVGNIVHESCLASADEDENEVIRTHGEIPETDPENTFNHVDLMELLGMDTSATASNTAGHRAYFLKGDLVLLQLALINYAVSFLAGRGYEPFYPPFFMNKGMMSNVAELAQFDEELYHVSGDGDDKYLIATAEQPLCAYQQGRWYQEVELKEPLKYAGYSTCFRKEAGSHGRDTLGIFRVHQFDKVEQFLVCSPRDGKSWELLEELITNSEEFYKSLGIPYRVVQIVAGALNLAAAKKYDLEGYFPASKTYRELVSCSNCTDYQSRALNCRFGPNMKGTAKDATKEYTHMLNSTLCAITRTMCALVENHQTDTGINIPEVLRPYMGGKEFIPFKGPKVRKQRSTN